MVILLNNNMHYYYTWIHFHTKDITMNNFIFKHVKGYGNILKNNERISILKFTNILILYDKIIDCVLFKMSQMYPLDQVLTKSE